jgi:hypothetical protein
MRVRTLWRYWLATNAILQSARFHTKMVEKWPNCSEWSFSKSAQRIIRTLPRCFITWLSKSRIRFLLPRCPSKPATTSSETLLTFGVRTWRRSGRVADSVYFNFGQQEY